LRTITEKRGRQEVAIFYLVFLAIVAILRRLLFLDMVQLKILLKIIHY